ncbi:hypothetical protein [Streptosporangium sp. NPDC002524]|uniref:hypothetical protein n=1 Tax=Streptosporangium sp. NPDC002524 TaxID=3154537 RepID=UPI00332ED205
MIWMRFARSWPPVVNAGASWTLVGFMERLELWEKNEPASAALDHVRWAILPWIMERQADPYKNVQREAEVPNLWFGKIAGTEHDGQIVCCSYWIEEHTRTVRCDLFSTLSMPV